jgi:ethanolamine utilization protein EutQ (cupin superfamily)
MIKRRQIAEDLLNRLEKIPLDNFERQLVEDLLERFIAEEKAKEETVRLAKKEEPPA